MAPRSQSAKVKVFKLCPKLIDGSMTTAQVAKATGLSQSTVRSYLSDFRTDAGIDPGTRARVPEGYHPPEKELQHWLPIKETVSELWQAQEVQSKAAIQKYHESLNWTIERKDKLPFGVAIVGDQHTGGLLTDHERMREDAQLISQTKGLSAAFIGDFVDNHVKHWSGILHQKLDPDEQFLLMEHYLGMFEGSVLVGITGNHDHWQYQKAGLDMTGRIFHSKNLIYAPHQLDVTIKVSGIEYSLCFRHHAPGASYLNKAHRHQRWLKHHGTGVYDAVVLGHLHETVCQAETYKGGERWFISPGSYKITDDWHQQFGFGAGRPSCPTLIMYPDKKRIVGLRDLRDAVKFLRMERGDK